MKKVNNYYRVYKEGVEVFEGFKHQIADYLGINISTCSSRVRYKRVIDGTIIVPEFREIEIFHFDASVILSYYKSMNEFTRQTGLNPYKPITELYITKYPEIKKYLVGQPKNKKEPDVDCFLCSQHEKGTCLHYRKTIYDVRATCTYKKGE